MALRWIEGFETDQGQTDLERKYAVASNSSAWSTTTGLRLGTALRSSGTTAELRTKALVAAVGNTWTMGFRFRGNTNITVGDHPGGMTLFSGSGDQLEFRFSSPTDNTMVVKVYRGATLLGTSERFFADDWYYLEFQAVVRTATNGSFSVKVDGVTVLTVSGVNTANQGTDGADRVRALLRITNGTSDWDDWYIRDDSTFLGDTVIQGILPTSDGNRTEWTPDTGSTNFDRVDDAAGSPSDSDKVTADTPGLTDLYGYANLTFAGTSTTIHGLQVNTSAFMGTSGTRTLRPKFRQSTTEADGTNFVVPNTTPNGYSEVFAVDPTDSAAWTKAKVDAIEIGVEVVS